MRLNQKFQLLKCCLLVVFAWLSCLCLKAQEVNVSVTIPPPYPIHFEDYLQFSNQTIVNLTNVSNSVKQVKLIATMEGNNGISAEVDPFYQPTAPIILNPFQSLTVTGGQMQSLNSNLTDADVNIQGIDLSTVIQTEKVPEGVYTICVEAFDYNTNENLSQSTTGCATVVISNYDPPRILTPTYDQHVPIFQPQMVNFSWTPSGIPGTTRYQVDIVDMTLNNLANPEDAFNNISVILHHRFDQLVTTNMQYGPGAPPLVKDHQYAIRVKAYDPNDLLSFKNDGYSNVSTFMYGKAAIVQDDLIDDLNLGGNNFYSYQNPCDVIACGPPAKSGEPTNLWQAGDEVQIGYFKLRFNTVVYNNLDISGTGEIEVPMFNSWIKVNFDNLNVNADGQVVGIGKIDGDFANGLQMDPKLKDIGGEIANVAGGSVQDVASFVKQGNRFIEAFGGDPVELPFAYKTNIGGVEQIISITAVEFTASGAKFNAFMHLEIPQADNQVLAFGATGICFHPTGLTENGLQKLYLVDDFSMNFGPNIDFTLKGEGGDEGGTYMRWDCEGYEEMQVEGEFEFTNEMLEPVDGNGTVKASLLTTVPSWGDMITTVDFDPFRVKGTKGLTFDFNEVTLDFSDVNNPNNMNFPPNYGGETDDTWQGFHFDVINVSLPDYLKKNGQPVVIDLQDGIIDKLGFTGKANVEPVVNFGDGSVDTWSFSIDKLALEFVNNSLQESSFEGKVGIPISDTGVGYLCLLNNAGSELETLFQIETLDDISVPMWKAEFLLLAGSTLSIESQGNDVLVQADLSGGVTIDAEFPEFAGLNINMPDMEFEGLLLRNQEPYISCQTFSLASPGKSFGGFEISINPEENENEGIDLHIDDDAGTARLDIGFSIILHNVGEGISGTTNMSIKGKLTEQQGLQKWKYDGFQLNLISIYAELAAVTIDGEIEFYNGDDTYGDGFRGSIDAIFKPVIAIGATIQFGKVDGYRYWYVDAKGILKTGGVPVGPGVSLYGFGGGAYYNMKVDDEVLPDFTDINDVQNGAKNVVDFDKDAAGQSKSGTKYLPFKPQSGNAFGFKASVVIGVSGDPTAFNADIWFEAAFSGPGGLDYIGIGGDAYFMTDLLERDNPKVRASVSLQLWPNEKKFHGELDFEVNIKNILETKGVNKIVFHSEPGTWYFLAGTPNDPIDFVVLKTLTVQTYFMMGNSIPAPPGLKEPFASRPEFQGFELSRGLDDPVAGVAFGQEFGFDSGKLKFLIFYAHLDVTFGYDVAILKNAMQCDGVEDPGINGWYAIGQAYSHIYFAAGIEINLWFLKADLEVFSADFYMAIQAGLPNPTWVRGLASGEFSALNGLISGSIHFPFEAGTVCLPPGDADPFGGVEVITDFYPDGEDVDPRTIPEAISSVTLGVEIPIEGINENNEPTTTGLKFFLKEMKVYKVGRTIGGNMVDINPEEVSGHFEITDDKIAHFFPDKNLDAFCRYEIRTTCFAKAKRQGTWKLVTECKDCEETAYQVKSGFFNTGKTPDKFSNKFIKNTYPGRGQRYTHRLESGIGVINFVSDESGIFNTQPTDSENYKYNFIAQFFKIGGGAHLVAESTLSYDSGSRRASFEMPKDKLEDESMYEIRFVAKLVKNPGAWLGINKDRYEDYKERDNLDNENYVDISKARINDGQSLSNEHVLYRLFFGTSKYPFFDAKWASYSQKSIELDPNPNFDDRILIKLGDGGEPFDFYDWRNSFYTIGSTPYPNKNSIQLNLENFTNIADHHNIHGNVRKIWDYYLKFSGIWGASHYGGYFYGDEERRKQPNPWAYAYNSQTMSGAYFHEHREKAIGFRYTGSGNTGRLTTSEINAEFFDGYDPNPAPSPGSSLAANVGESIPPASGMIVDFGAIISGPPVSNTATIIYDHCRISRYDNKIFQGVMYSIGFSNPNMGPEWNGKWHTWVTKADPPKTFKPKDELGSKYAYKMKFVLPQGCETSYFSDYEQFTY